MLLDVFAPRTEAIAVTLRQGDNPYGAVLVKDEVVMAAGYNTDKRDKDTTAHADW